MKLKEYQWNSIQKLRMGYVQGHRCQILQLATGGGKTFIASYLLNAAIRRGRKAYFIVDRLPLVEQAAKMFHDNGMHVGIVQADHPGRDHTAPVQVATVQTLARRPMPEDMAFGIIDEVHVLYRHHIKMLETFDVPFIGLSATPWSKGLGQYFSNLVVGATTSELIQSGDLVPYHVFAPMNPDLSNVKTVRGDYHQESLSGAMDKPQIVGDVVDHWMQHGEHRQTLIFAVNIAHSKHLVHEFKMRGIKVEHIDAYTDSDERRRLIERFKSGEITALSSVGVLTQGFDAPNVSCLVVARPTKSLMLHIQMLGRGLRTAPNKSDCLILDHAGNTLRLGFPDDPVPDELDTGDKKTKTNKEKVREEPLPKTCPKCMYLKPARIRECPSCGHIPEYREDVDVVDGSLVSTTKRNQEWTFEDKMRYAAMLKHYGIGKNYASGWWKHKFKEKFGSWPNDKRLKKVKPIEPDIRILAYIKHSQIKWARRKRAA